ncbi:carboxymuconolactone decarboxylase family protein [Streptomyces sp. NBC_01304]|uniref:carboxymuconolactone decarboxylase family protein n=1 Tax=Streptomyces sp. NBC_01304 TaxID=2903818 RepID=UPI002E0D760D|nr:carboxymuconolactone decarboxylase family protein [Streptomyces sp. NBC_01304]
MTNQHANQATEAPVAVKARMKSPAMVLPGVVQNIHQLMESARAGGVPDATLELVHLRVSQINGCGYCVDAGAAQARKAGMSEERISAVAAWREAPYYTASERAALSLAEYATRIADKSEPVPDDVWEEAIRYFDEKQMASLVMWIAITNLFNRINVPVRQPAGKLAG